MTAQGSAAMGYAVASFVAGGKANKEIAALLHIALVTVGRYTSRLYKRYGAKNRAHFVAKWLTTNGEHQT